MRHLKEHLKSSSTNPPEDVWECLALGVHPSGHNMDGRLEVENGLCGCVERTVVEDKVENKA